MGYNQPYSQNSYSQPYESYEIRVSGLIENQIDLIQNLNTIGITNSNITQNINLEQTILPMLCLGSRTNQEINLEQLTNNYSMLIVKQKNVNNDILASQNINTICIVLTLRKSGVTLGYNQPYSQVEYSRYTIAGKPSSFFYTSVELNNVPKTTNINFITSINHDITVQNIINNIDVFYVWREGSIQSIELTNDISERVFFVVKEGLIQNIYLNNENKVYIPGRMLFKGKIWAQDIDNGKI